MNSDTIRSEESRRLYPPESADDYVCPTCHQFFWFCQGHPSRADEECDWAYEAEAAS